MKKQAKKKEGYADVLLGFQWGDEGKGKVVDMLAEDYDIVARFQGGPNAGHTLEFTHAKQKVKVVLHMVPSGIMRKGVMNIVGNGVVFNPISFVKEMRQCGTYDSLCAKRIMVSDRATLIHPLYLAFDILLELARGKGNAIGTTAQGIGPAYGEHCYRKAMQTGDMILPKKEFMEKYDAIAKDFGDRIGAYKNTHNIDLFTEKNKDGKTYKEVFADMEREWLAAVEEIKKMQVVGDTVSYVNKALGSGKRILAEGAQGTMLDLDFGEYPNVTSSHTISSGACTGLGLKPQAIRKVIGVIKFYTTKVGGGTFICRMDAASEELFRNAGNEFGATTGRPRNCGWLDLVQLKYASALNGLTDLIVLKTDICPVKKLSIVTSYADASGKKYTDTMPRDLPSVSKVSKKTFPAWTIAPGTTNKKSVPKALAAYISYIEKELKVPVAYIGTGPNREDIIAWK